MVGLLSVNFMNSAPLRSLSGLQIFLFERVFAIYLYAFSQIKQREVFPGQMFEVEAAVIGRQNGTMLW